MRREKRREREEVRREKRRERGEGMRVYSLTPRLSLSRIYLSSE